nr:unconventional myosin-Ia-like isoform X2 [Pelodiscus sinensis]|eukprot:XP_006130875.1 unconventional myosin-Ia-like isoform X2 [Pelodiscus sinensis]
MKRSALLIQAYARGWKSRRLLRELKHDRRCHQASATISAYWKGYKTRKEYKKYFRSGASIRLANFIYRRLLQKFFVGLRTGLPPLAVSDRSWPAAPYKFLANTNEELKKIFYCWKVRAPHGSCQRRGPALAAFGQRNIPLLPPRGEAPHLRSPLHSYIPPPSIPSLPRSAVPLF